MIKVNDKRKIAALQEEFNQLFPYLNLEFFSKPHKTGEGSAKTFIQSNAKTLGECRTLHQDGSINIVPTMTVAELEQEFREVFGLSVQVFRKSGKIWLETTVTDSWTLKKQNTEGEALSQKSA